VRVDEVIKSAIDRAGVIRVKNAMNPLLWLSPISATICWIAAYGFRDDPVLKYGFAGLGARPIVASLLAYFLYFILDRDRLQTEEFVIRQRELSIIERKGLPPVPFDRETEDIQVIGPTEKASRGQQP
jgi:hypothetical protein